MQVQSQVTDPLRNSKRTEEHRNPILLVEEGAWFSIFQNFRRRVIQSYINLVRHERWQKFVSFRKFNGPASRQTLDPSDLQV